MATWLLDPVGNCCRPPATVVCVRYDHITLVLYEHTLLYALGTRQLLHHENSGVMYNKRFGYVLLNTIDCHLDSDSDDDSDRCYRTESYIVMCGNNHVLMKCS